MRWCNLYKVNFLPPELQRDFVIDFNKLVAGTIFALIIAGVLGVYGFFLYQLHHVKMAVAEAGQYLESLQADVAAVEEVKKQRIKNEQTAESLRQVMEKRILWAEVLAEVNSSLPADMWLVRLDLGHRDLPSAPGLKTEAGTKERKDERGWAGDIPPAALPQAPPVHPRQDLRAGEAGSSSETAPPAPNVMVFEGCSRSVSSVGMFVNNLCRIPVFSKILLNELSGDEKTAAYRFKITALLKGGNL